jgi:hypothetical protein
MVEYNIVKQIKHPKKISSITLIHKTVVLSHIPQKLLTIQNQLLTHTNQSLSIYHNSALLKTIELEINDVKCLKKQLVIADRSGAIIMKDYFLDTIWKFKYSNSCCPLVLFDHFVLSLVKDQVLFVHSGDLIKVITMDGYCVGGCAGNFTAKKNVDMDVDLGSSQIDDTESIASFNSFSSSVINSDPPKEIIIILQDALYLINDDALSTNEYIPKLYIDLDFFVTKVYAFRPSWLDHDLLITTGHFCGIRIYDQNQVVVGLYRFISSMKDTIGSKMYSFWIMIG